MKSIVIIIAIFLVTLTAKADWVKSGELEYLQISDSSFDFAKVNYEGTKIVTVSTLEKKLKLWDLNTGKLLRELAMPYYYTRIEYDFRQDRLYFNTTSTNSNFPKVNSDVTWFIDSLGKLNFIYYNYNNKFDNYSIVKIGVGYNSLYVIDTNLYSTVGFRDLSYGGGKSSFEVLMQVYNFSSSTYTSSSLFGGNLGEQPYKGGVYYVNGINYSGRDVPTYEPKYLSYATNWGNFGISINDLSSGIMFNSKSFQMLDIDYGYVVCSDNQKQVKFLSIQNKTSGIIGKYPISKVRHYKLIKSLKNAMFLKGKDTLAIYDNELGKEIAEYQFKDGQLSYNDEKQIIFSYSGNKIYKLDISNLNLEQLFVMTDKSHYFIGDTVNVTTALPKLITDVIIEFNGVKSYGRTAKAVMDKVGSYDVKITYIENGQSKVIINSNKIKVIERFKPTLIVYHPNSNMYGIPFKFSCSSNYQSKDVTYTFLTKEKIITRDELVVKEIREASVNINGDSISYYFGSVDNYNFTLICSTEFESVALNGSVKVRPFCSFTLGKYSGNVPLTTTWESKYSAPNSFGPKFFENWDATLIIGNERINSKTFTINKPGVYPIKVELNSIYLQRKEIYTTNQVLKVLDTTIFQAFPIKFRNSYSSNKYAMTQDADGYYMEFGIEEADVQLFDSMGRLIKSYHIKDEQYIRKEDLERGVYFLQINVNGEVFHEKVLVE